MALRAIRRSHGSYRSANDRRPVEGRKAVREQFNYGADLIKIYGTDRYSFFPMAKSSASLTSAWKKCRRSWMRRIEGPQSGVPRLRWSGTSLLHRRGVASIEHGIQLDDDAIRKMVAKGIYLVPTLYVYCCALEKGDLAMSGGKTSRLAIHEVSFKKALAAGVKIAFGTDAGPFPHGTQAVEFEWMTRMACQICGDSGCNNQCC